MKRHRNLTAGEIERLERNGCRAEDWNSVDVAEGFCTDHVHNASFYGHPAGCLKWNVVSCATPEYAMPRCATSR